MAYKPKFAQTKSNSGRTSPRETAARREQSRQERKKMGKGMLILFIRFPHS